MLALTDHLSLDTLRNPVLASDGETYSKDMLLAAMAADPWHRSPVTGEVLRAHAFRNRAIEALLGEPPERDDGVVVLYDRDAAPPDDAFVWTYHVPRVLKADDTLLRRAWGIPDEAFSVSFTVRQLPRHTYALMHPPCAEEMRADALRMAALLGVDKQVVNPGSLTTGVVSTTGRTLEEHWMAARARPRHGADVQREHGGVGLSGPFRA